MKNIITTMLTISIVFLLLGNIFSVVSAETNPFESESSSSSGSGGGSTSEPITTAPSSWGGGGSSNSGYIITDYYKFCYYPWDASKYVGKTVRIDAVGYDLIGNKNMDSIDVKIPNLNEIEVVKSYSTSKSQLNMFLARPPESLGNGKFEVRTSTQGPNEMGDVLLSFLVYEEPTLSSDTLINSYCNTATSGYK